MSVRLSTSRLRYELARRGWGHSDLARVAGISAPTVSAAMAGKAMAPRTLKRIAAALVATPPVDGVDDLLAL
jgi:transcriptional regulator with XRE-family HTH domain